MENRRTASLSREAELEKRKLRRKSLLYLVRKFLLEEGYAQSAAALESESNLTHDYVVCDNVDLVYIIQDYETYYRAMFHKDVNLLRRINCPKFSCDDKNSKVNQRSAKRLSVGSPRLCGSIRISGMKTSQSCDDQIGVSSLPEMVKAKAIECSKSSGDIQSVHSTRGDFLEENSGSNYTESEIWREYASCIRQEIIEANLNVSWNDVVGLDLPKAVLREAVIYPLRYPEVFQNLNTTPWKGLLLYGPPGTGKTLLAKAVASECENSTFFNMSTSALVSKWRGDSEKLIRTMFDMARKMAPSIIFIDEVDSIMSTRGCISEHEASRRMKSELLIQFDGLQNENKNVFIMATTNMPWLLDPGFVRRFERKIFVGYPNAIERKTMFEKFLPNPLSKEPILETSLNYSELADLTNSFTGSDIKIICKEVIMKSAVTIFKQIEEKKSSPQITADTQLKPITNSDVIKSIRKSHSNIHQHSFLTRYKEWMRKYQID